MSGHSKWSTIKRKKEILDSKRGKVFTKIAREIMVAARNGGADPGANPRLRLALSAARAANMPKDNQERAIKKGTGEGGDGVSLDEVVYEGRGPQGTAFVLEVVTDNKNRTVAEIRHMFGKAGGEMSANGSVSWMFERLGVISVPKAAIAEDPLTERVLEAGGDDVKDAGEEWIVLCAPTALSSVQSALEHLEPSSAGLQFVAKPESMVGVEGESAVAVAQFWAKLDEHDDVQSVFTNAELPPEVLEEHGP